VIPLPASLETEADVGNIQLVAPPEVRAPWRVLFDVVTLQEK
jgi:hypothetical protein